MRNHGVAPAIPRSIAWLDPGGVSFITQQRQRLVEPLPTPPTARQAVTHGDADSLGGSAASSYRTAMVSQSQPGVPLWDLWSMGRIGLFAVAAGLPVLSISAHVLGIVSIDWAAWHLVVPALLVALALVLVRVPEARVVRRGALAGLIAVITYDCTRLPFVLFGLWADFIPRVGGWVVLNDGSLGLHAVLGYTWRYFGNGLGIGVFFFLVCAVLRVRRHIVAFAVAYGVFVWSGLMATVILAEHGQKLLFALTPLSVTVSLAGHLVYGLVLGLIKARFVRHDAGLMSSHATLEKAAI